MDKRKYNRKVLMGQFRPFRKRRERILPNHRGCLQLGVLRVVHGLQEDKQHLAEEVLQGQVDIVKVQTADLIDKVALPTPVQNPLPYLPEHHGPRQSSIRPIRLLY